MASSIHGTVRESDQQQRFRSTAFAGLDQTQLASIYNTGRVRQLARGESIDISKHPGSCWAVVTGSVGLFCEIGGNNQVIDTIGPGSWFGTTSECPMPESAAALQQSTVMEFSPAAFRALPEKVQLAIIKSFSQSAAKALGAARLYAGRVSQGIACTISYVESTRNKQRAFAHSRFAERYLAGIPRLPQYATDLAIKLLSDKATVQEVIEGIKQDPSPATLVLKTVNSPYYGLRTSVSDYYRACLLLGFNNVYRLVIDVAVDSIMPDTEEFRQIQQRSYLVSLLAQEIARRSSGIDPQFAATVGLLHDIGGSAVLLLQNQHREHAEAIAMLDDARIGARLLRALGLPEQLAAVIENQHLVAYAPPSQFPPDIRLEIAALSLAKTCARRLQYPGEQHPSDPPASSLFQLLGLPDANPGDFFSEKIIPALTDQKKCMPQNIQKLLPDAH